MKKSKVSPTNQANNMRSAEEALKQKYNQYNQSLLQMQNKNIKTAASSGNSAQSEQESTIQKQVSLSPNGNTTSTTAPVAVETRKFFQKKGRNEKKLKKASSRINAQGAEEDVQLNVRFNQESRRLASILLKENAAFTTEPVNGNDARQDKFGNQIDHAVKRQKISFNEDITVYEVDNWKKYNNSMYDDDDEKCHCNLLRFHEIHVIQGKEIV